MFATSVRLQHVVNTLAVGQVWLRRASNKVRDWRGQRQPRNQHNQTSHHCGYASGWVIFWATFGFRIQTQKCTAFLNPKQTQNQRPILNRICRQLLHHSALQWTHQLHLRPRVWRQPAMQAQWPHQLHLHPIRCISTVSAAARAAQLQLACHPTGVHSVGIGGELQRDSIERSPWLAATTGVSPRGSPLVASCRAAVLRL